MQITMKNHFKEKEISMNPLTVTTNDGVGADNTTTTTHSL